MSWKILEFFWRQITAMILPRRVDLMQVSIKSLTTCFKTQILAFNDGWSVKIAVTSCNHLIACLALTSVHVQKPGVCEIGEAIAIGIISTWSILKDALCCSNIDWSQVVWSWSSILPCSCQLAEINKTSIARYLSKWRAKSTNTTKQTVKRRLSCWSSHDFV